jgi:hypothetical protein
MLKRAEIVEVYNPNAAFDENILPTGADVFSLQALHQVLSKDEGVIWVAFLIQLALGSDEHNDELFEATRLVGDIDWSARFARVNHELSDCEAMTDSHRERKLRSDELPVDYIQSECTAQAKRIFEAILGY